MFAPPERLPQDGAWAALRSSAPAIVRVQAYVNQVAAETGLPLSTRGFGPDRVFLSFRDVRTAQVLDFVAAASGASWCREGSGWTLVLSPGPTPSLPRPAWRETESVLQRFRSSDAFLQRLSDLQRLKQTLRQERKEGWIQTLEKVDAELANLEIIGDPETFDFLRAVRATPSEPDGWRPLLGGAGAFENAEGLWKVDEKGVTLKLPNDLNLPTEQPPDGFDPGNWAAVAALPGSLKAETLEEWYRALTTLTPRPIVGGFGFLPLRSLARDGRSLVETGQSLVWPAPRDGGFVFRLQHRDAVRTSEPADDALRLLEKRPLSLVAVASFFQSFGKPGSWARSVRPSLMGFALPGVESEVWQLWPLLGLPLGVLDRLDRGEAIPVAELPRSTRAELFRLINAEVYGANTLTPLDLFGGGEKPVFLYLERLAPSSPGQPIEHTLYLGFDPRDARTLRFHLP